MRVRMTKAEAVLWSELRAHRLDGLSFRRQSPMGAYIVDFVCHAAKLIVEADGQHHSTEPVRVSDKDRDAALSAMGYFVLRFTNAEILEARDHVIARIRAEAHTRAPCTPPTQPSPARGEGLVGDSE